MGQDSDRLRARYEAVILNNTSALFHFQRQLPAIARRIEKRKAEGLPVTLQELDYDAARFAVSALEFTIASLEYEQSHKEI
jgi:hypothetical protein